MAGPGRPREQNVTKWARWKRLQRSGTRAAHCSKCGSSNQLIQHHTSGSPHSGGTVTLCRACHAKVHATRALS